jgi:pimeloyl-ACP methyl ester carboxylesterase
MPKSTHLAVLLALGWLTIRPAHAQDMPDYTPVYFPTPCPYPVPEEGITCGTMIVPEDRWFPDDDKVQITVAVLPAQGQPVPEPVFYLAGGPGGSALLEIDAWLDHDVRQNHDLILYDQRGTGFSKPSLNCPEVETGYAGVYKSPVEACYRRLRDDLGIDMNDYHSVASAQDFNDLRRVLGYEQVNLYGISYGTRLALTIMRDYPDTVRAVVLDSVLPPEADKLADLIYNRVSSFRNLFRACGSDPVCRAAYPDLEQRFYRVVDRYNAQPALIDHPFYGRMQLTGDDIANGLFLGLYRTEAIGTLPFGIYVLDVATQPDELAFGFDLINGQVPREYLETGNYDYVEGVRGTAEVQAYMDEVGDITIAEGVNFAIDCAEEYPFSNVNDVMSNDAFIVPPSLQRYVVFNAEASRYRCQVWRVRTRSFSETERVISATPALVMAGAFDPITSVTWSMSAQAGLSNSAFLLFSYGGHGVSVDACGMRLMTDFLLNPAQDLDTSCTQQPVTFYGG